VLAEAARIWRPLGLTIEWSDDRGDLRLVVSDDRLDAPSRWTTALGWLEFVDGEPGRVLHVSVGGAARLIDSLHVAGRTVADLPSVSMHALLVRTLGRAAAHEIGHYVLASPAHTRRGLMRATYPQWEMSSPELDRYRLDAKQMGALGARVGNCRW
jgi:hypothetical protein